MSLRDDMQRAEASKRVPMPALCARCDAPVQLEFNPLRWVNAGSARTHKCPRKQRKE